MIKITDLISGGDTFRIAVGITLLAILLMVGSAGAVTLNVNANGGEGAIKLTHELAQQNGEFFIHKILEGNQIQVVNPFSPNLPSNNFKPEIGSDGTIPFVPDESKSFSLNSFSTSVTETPIEDLNPPKLLDFEFIPTSIDTRNSAQTVTFTLRSTDDLSGFDYGYLYFISPSGQQWRYGYFGEYQRISGDDLDGVYQGTIEFPQYSDPGTWRINYLIMWDKVGNSKYLNEQDFINSGFPTKLEVFGNDVIPPQLIDFHFTPTNIDTSNSPQTVTFTLRSTDDLSGFDYGNLNFVSPSGQQQRSGYVSEYHRISGDALDGVYQGTIEFPRYSEAGTWRISYLNIRDQVGNSKYLYEQDFTNLGFPTKLEVFSVPSDTTRSQLQEFSFSPTIINTRYSSQTVTFTLRSTDDLSGFYYGYLYIESPSGQQRRYGYVGEYQRISGDALDGVYQVTIEFPRYSEAGTWHISSLSIWDKAGNSKYLYEQDFINSGFPTKLENLLLPEVPLPPSESFTLGSFPNGLFSNDPINMGTGNYFYQYKDLFIPGRGLPPDLPGFIDYI